MKTKGRVKITIRLEKGEHYIEKLITEQQVCALLDLQYMMTPETWDTARINKIDNTLKNFFKTIDHIDAAMHGNKSYNGRWEEIKGSSNTNLYGKPKWRKVEL